nr:TPM domain-containing protein [Oscillatoria sp. PCC 10802]
MINPLLAVQFKQILGAGMLSIAALSIPPASVAVTVQHVPNPRQVNGGWVRDMAGVLSPSTEAQLNHIISQLEAKRAVKLLWGLCRIPHHPLLHSSSLQRYVIPGELAKLVNVTGCGF